MAAKHRKLSFGPGFLVTAAFIGPGTVTSCSIAGAHFGFALIYALVFATVTTIILQEMTGRLALGSNFDLAQALKEFPKKSLTKGFFVILTLSSITFGCAAYEAGNVIGGSLGLEIATSIPRRFWVVLISATAIFILSRRKYRIVEKFLIFLVFLMSISFLVTLVIVRPDLKSMFKGLIPSFPDNSLYLILALVGTTVVPYNLFLHSSAVKLKWKTAEHLGNFRLDLLISVALGGIISSAIIVASAVAYHDQGITLEKGVQLGEQLKPLFGPLAHFLFGIGLFAAGMSSALTAPYAAAFAASGVLGWKGGPDSPGFRAVWLGVILTGFIVSIFQFNPLTVILFAQAANGIILPVASVFLLLVLNNKQKMGSLANTSWQNIIGALVILIVTLLGLWNIARIF